MGSVQRILKNLIAVFVSNIISIVTELVQPAVFIHSYGTSYADWIVLTAAVSYLSTLNFGLQTFVTQDLAVRYNRGERESYHVQQSTALRVLLGITTVAATICLVIFWLPVERWLNLSIGHWTASVALYFIALQVLVGALIFSYFAATFMGVGLSHRGTNWVNAQRFGSAALVTLLAWLHMSFAVLAISQFCWYIVLLAAMMVDLKRVGAEIFPTLRYWDGVALKAMLKPSAYFGVIYWSTFLTYQLPVILLQKIVGPGPVVMFTLGRKIFGLGRQVLNGITQSMGPEITRLYGQEDWPAMSRLYSYSERMIFTLIGAVNLPLFFLAPALMHFWLLMARRGGINLFELIPFLLMAAINTTLCVKEHKFQFQFSTNSHIELARVMVGTYLTMVVVSIGTIYLFGLSGFLVTWLVAELVQTTVIMRLNNNLFSHHEQLGHHHVLRLATIAVIGLTVGAFALHATRTSSYPVQIGVGVLLSIPVLVVSFLAFGMKDLSSRMRGKVWSAT